MIQNCVHLSVPRADCCTVLEKMLITNALTIHVSFSGALHGQVLCSCLTLRTVDSGFLLNLQLSESRSTNFNGTKSWLFVPFLFFFNYL